MERCRGNTKTLIYQHFVAYSQPKRRMLNAIPIVHKYSPLDAALLSYWGELNLCPHQEVPWHPRVEFTAVSPGRGSERKQCLGWRVWGRAWRWPAAPASVWPAPALHMSENRPVAETGEGRQKRGEKNFEGPILYPLYQFLIFQPRPQSSSLVRLIDYPKKLYRSPVDSIFCPLFAAYHKRTRF